MILLCIFQTLKWYIQKLLYASKKIIVQIHDLQNGGIVNPHFMNLHFNCSAKDVFQGDTQTDTLGSLVMVAECGVQVEFERRK